MSKDMKALYLSTKGDDTIDLPVPLEVQNYLCSIVEMSGNNNNNNNNLLPSHSTCIMIGFFFQYGMILAFFRHDIQS